VWRRSRVRPLWQWRAVRNGFTLRGTQNERKTMEDPRSSQRIVVTFVEKDQAVVAREEPRMVSITTANGTSGVPER